MKLWPLLLITCAAQAAPPAALRQLSYDGKNAIRMPFVQLADPRSAARINDRLFIDLMGSLAPVRPVAAFGAADGVALDGLVRQTYSVIRNDERLLTLEFDSLRCTTTCTGTTRYVSFDMRDGRLVKPADLFTPAGIALLGRLSDNERLQRYRKHVRSLRSTLRAAQSYRPAPGHETVADMSARLANNLQCEQSLSEEADVERTVTVPGVELAGNALTLHSTGCGQAALDDVGDVRLAMPYSAVADHMTVYGKALLLGQGTDSRPFSVDGQLARGIVGGTMYITLLVDYNAGDGWRGIYFYDRQRKKIALTGHNSGNEIVLTESTAEPATLRFVVEGGRASGQFVGKKTYALELRP